MAARSGKPLLATVAEMAALNTEPTRCAPAASCAPPWPRAPLPATARLTTPRPATLTATPAPPIATPEPLSAWPSTVSQSNTPRR